MLIGVGRLTSVRSVQSAPMGPLDLAGGSPGLAGIGVRALSRAYAKNYGPLLVLRRSSDNGTMTAEATPIGLFSSEVVSAWAGASTIYVAGGYEQTTGALAIQNTAALQPKLVLNGLNGLPTIIFGDGTSFCLVLADYPAIQNMTQRANGMWLAACATCPSAPSQADRLYSKQTASGNIGNDYGSNSAGMFSYVPPQQITFPAVPFAQGFVLDLFEQVSGSNLTGTQTINGASPTTSANTGVAGSSDAGNPLYIGNYWSGASRGWNGGVSEILFFDGGITQTSAAEAVRKNIGNFYGVSIS